MSNKQHNSFSQNNTGSGAKGHATSHGMKGQPQKRVPGRFNFSMRPQKRFGDAKTPAPFPQKPPFRPDGKEGASFSPQKSFQRFVRPRPPKTRLTSYAPLPVQAGKRAATSWGTVATWYDKHLESPGTYHEKVILPNLLRLVDPQKGDVILDLAAGQGHITRALAKNGAQLTGLDISPELIAIAKKKRRLSVTFAITDYDSLLEKFGEGRAGG